MEKILVHGDERAPAAAASEEGEKSVWALRRIDLQTGQQRLDSSVCIAAEEGLPLPAAAPVEPHHWTTIFINVTSPIEGCLLETVYATLSLSHREGITF